MTRSTRSSRPRRFPYHVDRALHNATSPYDIARLIALEQGEGWVIDHDGERLYLLDAYEVADEVRRCGYEVTGTEDVTFGEATFHVTHCE